VPGAEVRFNRIYENGVGVEVGSESLVHHNLIYRNTGQGVLVNGAKNANLTNNTIVALGGDGVRLVDFIDNVVLRNNVVWSQGTGLFVEPEAQGGFDSDYNNWYAAAGNVASHGKVFDDLFDVHVEVETDLHSKGRTAPDPTRDNPLFVDMASDDYHLQSGSTSIDAGDPATPHDLEPGPAGDRVNLGAYGNTADATSSPTSWLSIVYPEFYVDLDDDLFHEIRWETFNVTSGVNLQIDLIQEVSGTTTSIGTVAASAGMTTQRSGDHRQQYGSISHRVAHHQRPVAGGTDT